MTWLGASRDSKPKTKRGGIKVNKPFCVLCPNYMELSCMIYIQYIVDQGQNRLLLSWA